MHFVCRTQYTYPTLKTFNRHHAPGLLVSLLVTEICGLLLALMVGLLVALAPQQLSSTLTALVIAAVACILLPPIAMLSRRHAMVRQAAREMLSTVTFDEGEFSEHTVGDAMSTTTYYLYSAILKVTACESAVYLYIAPNAAIILSKYGFTEGDADAFVDFLRTKLPSDAIKIK